MKYMKRFLLVLCVLLMTVGCYGAYLWKTKPVQKAVLPQEWTTLSGSASPSAISLHSQYSCLMDADSGRVLYGTKENEKKPMASTTKIMTALLILEDNNPDSSVSFSSYACSMPKVHLGVRPGETFKTKDLLYSLLLESHNDTAVALAESCAGSVSAFARKMNEKAASLGMKQTHFVTPNGLDAKGHYSSSKDMCILASYALKNKEFCQIIKTQSHSFSSIKTDNCSSRIFSVSNKDLFLSSYDGALGIKTGFTSKAGYCFVGAARRQDKTLVSCVLASGWPPNKSFKWADTKTLMDYGMNNYEHSSLPLPDLGSCRIPVTDGKEDFVCLSTPDPSQALLGRHDEIKIHCSFSKSLCAPIRSNIAVGTIEYYINGKLFLKKDVFPQKSIEKSSISDKIWDVLQCITDFLCP